jgi:hypothetical protein
VCGRGREKGGGFHSSACVDVYVSPLYFGFEVCVCLCASASFQVESLASERLAVVIISTYADAKPPESAAWFCRWLDESATDFRVGAGMLQVRHHPTPDYPLNLKCARFVCNPYLLYIHSQLECP